MLADRNGREGVAGVTIHVHGGASRLSDRTSFPFSISQLPPASAASRPAILLRRVVPAHVVVVVVDVAVGSDIVNSGGSGVLERWVKKEESPWTPTKHPAAVMASALSHLHPPASLSAMRFARGYSPSAACCRRRSSDGMP